MTPAVRFRITARSEAALLCRLLGLFAQLGLAAPKMSVRTEGDTMHVEALLAHFGEHLVLPLARKMAGFVGVDAVAVEETDPIV